MFDTFGVNEHGSLDQDGFCKYRESIEITYPLVRDMAFMLCYFMEN
jgi:hypothetical protein